MPRTLLSIPSIILLVLVSSGSIGCHPREVDGDRYRFSRIRMGARAEIVLYATDESTANDAAEAAFAAMAALEEVLSDWSLTSEVAAIRASPAGLDVPISPELDRALAHAEQIARQTDGAFDVSCGALTRLWRTARVSGKPPSDAEIEAARSSSGYLGLIRSEGPTGPVVRFDRPGMELDFGAIGKGMAVDGALQVLGDRGCPRSLVSLGGDLAVGSPPPGRVGWTIATTVADVTLELSHVGVATSGVGEQHLVDDGLRLSHILDPRTGRAVADHADITVIAPCGATADAWASAAAVVGVKEARRRAPPTVRFLTSATATD